jgi:hypothetical protein
MSIREFEQGRNHYTYYSHEEYGRGYIGVRSCDCLPEEDTDYFGSFSDKSFNPTQKVILKSDYNTRKDANEDEIILHDFYDVVKNPHFANRAKHTSTGFCTEGVTFGEETRQKMRESHLGLFDGENNPNFGKSPSEKTREKIGLGNKGKYVSAETRQKQSDALRGENNPMFGKIGENNPNFGSKRNEETRKRMSSALLGENNPTSGTVWWVNCWGETTRQVNSPGPQWQRGRKFQEIQCQ